MPKQLHFSHSTLFLLLKDRMCALHRIVCQAWLTCWRVGLIVFDFRIHAAVKTDGSLPKPVSPKTLDSQPKKLAVSQQPGAKKKPKSLRRL